jgi:hypothetical protein
MGIVVAKQVADETAIVFDVGIDRCREAVRVNTVTFWLMVYPICWVVDCRP